VTHTGPRFYLACRHRSGFAPLSVEMRQFPKAPSEMGRSCEGTGPGAPLETHNRGHGIFRTNRASTSAAYSSYPVWPTAVRRYRYGMIRRD